MSTTSTQPAFDLRPALKDRHRRMWALGDYPAVADQVIPALGRIVADATGASHGHRVLDVAAGSGNASLPAARAGADVVALDLTPELLAVGRQAAEREGLAVTWQQGDAESLPYPDGQFDAAMSCVGVMFAPSHQRCADELLRVLRPDGTLALASWTPEGFIGQMFATMKPYVPAPPAGSQPPPLWGSEAHVRELLGDGVDELRAERAHLPVDTFADAEQFLDFFRSRYGPTIAAYAGLAQTPDRAAALDADLLALADSYDLGHGRMEWEYLLVTARKR